MACENADHEGITMTQETLPQEIIERYRRVAVATVYSALQQMGYTPCLMKGVRAFTPGTHLVGTARTLRGCLQSLKLVLNLMNEPQIVPQRPDRRTVGDPRPPTPTSQTRRPAPYSGPAGGSERHPVSASEWMPLADGPARSASLADPVQILPQLDHGWNVGTSQ